ncbi:hypothetical protein GCM10011487_43290 [Steroidobacter agaridevorans]|uniref:Uncharacterized protein n=1 Tax=Steroidobacter agaridevorans TaxID=2695856 RepID=A0A829YGE6_9GAMM|nr:DUF6152 family protein [Steroidobacter agaridevorans]GFE82329.1 hypothetical protein GCM10011487_43290 [Steroidobacter agaridevorans]GFE85283.1 hypothetical protein GCM10011488_02370 [Steroidobacter agaridevorans]
MGSISRIVSGCVAAALLSAAVPSLAHHSFPATYYIDKSVTIKGKVVQFMFRNPHSMIIVLAPGPDGKDVRYAVEWAAAGALAKDGQASRESLKPGDVVIITGAPGRQETDHKIRLNQIERPADGWKWGGTFE